MAAKKKIEIVYDVDGKPIDVAIDKTLNLKQQVRELTKEINKTKEGTKEFELLSAAMNDAKDNVDRVNAKSREFFSTLSLLPGPIGDLAGKLDGAISLLKTFSGFSLKDIGTQLKGLGKDIGEVIKNLLGLTVAQETEAVAATEAAVANAANTAALEAETVATEQAAVATESFGNKLKALGRIGILAIIAAATYAIYKLVDAYNSLTAAQQAENEVAKKAAEMGAENITLLERIDTTIKKGNATQIEKNELVNKYNEKLGDTFGKVKDWKELEDKLVDNLPRYVAYLQAKAKADAAYALVVEANKKIIEAELTDPASLAGAYDVWSRGGILGFFYEGKQGTGEAIQKETIAKLNKGKSLLQGIAATAQTELDKLGKDLKIKAPEVKGAETKTKTVKDDNQRLLDLAKKYEADLISIQTKGDRERQVQDIKNAADAEKREVGKLEGITKENEKVRSKILIDIETAAEGKLTKLREGWAAEDLKQRETYLKKISDLQIKANEDNYALQTQALNKQLELDIAAWNKEVEEFNKKNEKIQISEEQQKAYIIALRKSTQDQIQKITDEGILKSIQKNAQIGNFTLQNVLDVATQFQGDLINQISNLPKDFFGVFFGSTKKQMQNLFAETTRMEVYYYDERGKRIEKVLDSEIKFAEEAYRKKEKQIKKEVADAEERNQFVTINRKTGVASERLSDEKLAEFKILKQKELLDAYKQYADKKMAYDKLMQDSEYAVTDAVVQNFEKTSALINALSQIKDAQWTADAQRFDDQLALYEEDSDEYKKILKEKRAAEEEYLKQVKKMQIAAALVDAGVSIARVIIDTQRAIIAYKASVAALGPVGAGLAASYAIQSKIGAALAIATITASGIAKIKNINSQSASTSTGDSAGGGGTNMGRGYAEGGMIEGPRHAGGGVMINAEGGEAVMTRGAVTMFGPMLSAMNQMGGGTSFTKGAVGMARPDNPEVKNVPLQNSTQIIKTYVVESELTSAQQRQARLKDLSTL
jgi:hypothetical protein